MTRTLTAEKETITCYQLTRLEKFSLCRNEKPGEEGRTYHSLLVHCSSMKTWVIKGIFPNTRELLVDLELFTYVKEKHLY